MRFHDADTRTLLAARRVPRVRASPIDYVRAEEEAARRREMKLALARVAEDVTVGQDPRERALDPSCGNTFGNPADACEQIEALPARPRRDGGCPEGDGWPRRDDRG